MTKETLKNLLIALGAVWVLWVLGGDLYDRFLQLLQIVIWPGVVLFALLFFQKVFAYLFFSLDEFNFFGAKGSLKNVREVIEEKAQEIRGREKLQEEHEKKLEELKNSTVSQEQQLDDAVDFAEELLKQNDELTEEVTDLKNTLSKERIGGVSAQALQAQVAALLNQIQSLQAQLYKRDDTERQAEPPEEATIDI